MSEEPGKKKRFFLNHKKSSALVVSIALHVGFVIAAVTFVAVKAVMKEETTFEAAPVERPQMKLKKLQVPVKNSQKSQAPKLRQTIVSRPKTSVSIQMPEMTGIAGGIGYGKGSGMGGMGVGFNLDLFGGSGGSGNELIGTFYDLKQDTNRQPTEMADLIAEIKDPFNSQVQEAACRIIRRFVGSRCDEKKLSEYFKAPKLKYGTAFMMPPMNAGAAPQAFSVQDDVKPSFWICHYKGQIAAPESGSFRFCGIGDDILIVMVNGKVVLDACWPELIGLSTDWESKDSNSRQFSLNGYKYGKFDANVWQDLYQKIEKRGGYDGGSHALWGNAFRGTEGMDHGNGSYMKAASRMVLGDWVPMTKGKRVNIDIVIGEVPGGEFNCRLLIEQKGKTYRMVQSDNGPRPILPVFKTKEINNNELLQKMELDPQEMTMEGPVFGALTNGQK